MTTIERDVGYHSAPVGTSSRIQAVDVARGVAIAGVVVFHLVWNLAFLGLTSPGLASHPFWLAFGLGLAGTFMLLVGVSLVLAARRGLDGRLFGRRLAILALAALAITVVTRLAFPDAFVYFGILHAIAVASLLGVPLLRLPTWGVVLVGLTMIVLGNVLSFPAFDTRWLAWIGFAAAPAPSNDFVPVFPWIGLTALGIALARIGLARGWTNALPAFDSPIGRVLAVLGRWSLPIYLLHQPLLLAILVPLSWVANA
ncbi:MAG: heparan-alpha-glucosaminide N-acetyltransferase [Jannaschia sp.]